MRRGTFRYLYCARRLHQSRLKCTKANDEAGLKLLPKPPTDDSLDAANLALSNSLPGEDDFPDGLAVAPVRFVIVMIVVVFSFARRACLQGNTNSNEVCPALVIERLAI